MNRSVAIALLSVVLVAGNGGCLIMDFGPVAWVSQEETLTLPIDGDVQTVAVSTHNGYVEATGSDSVGDAIVVHVTKKAGGGTIEDAEACMEAIQLITDRSGSTQKVGWKWATPRKRRWRAQVSFDVTSPQSLGVDLETHNGRITVTGMEGTCKVLSHNGRIQLHVPSRDVTVRTHNGRVDLAADCERIYAETHNGRIVARLNGEQNVAGRITSHNGSVTVVMNKSGAANFDCRTHNGGIHSSLELMDADRGKRSLRGRYGDASGTLAIETHNGSITLK